MKKFVHLMLFWAVALSLNAQNNCNVSIGIDSTNSGDVVLVAYPAGTSPFTYAWSTGETTQSIVWVANGVNYCVSVTDANGCVATECLYNPSPDNCTAAISVEYLSNGSANVTGTVSGTPPLLFSFNADPPAWTSLPSASVNITVETSGLWCINVEDADGCVSSTCQWVQIGGQNACDVYITYDSLNSGGTVLTAIASGTPPFVYLWSTGETTPSIPLTPLGTNACVSVTDANGCVASACLFNTPPACSVFIGNDPASPGLAAYASGVAPFAYLWSNGLTTQIIPPNALGTYCVTTTDANGCTASDCYYYSGGGNNTDSCYVWVFESDTIGVDVLYAITPPGNFSYLWNNGTTGPTLEPNAAGTYCVTVTGNGCVSSNCYDYAPFVGNQQISGYVYFPDSINANIMEGTVDLYFLDAATNEWNLVNTVPIQSDPNGWSNHYDFGQVADGQYLVLASLDPSSPYIADYLPTYHFNTVYWDEANVIAIPGNSNWGLYNIVFDDGQNFTGGSGNIGGTVTEGDGFTANGDGDRGGAPLEGVTILLLDSNEQPITHDITDAIGEYSFGNLPFGTYKVVVEIVGKEQVGRWVTLSADNPNSSGNDFEVTESGIVSGISDLVAKGHLTVFPNPANDWLNVQLESAEVFEAQISLTTLAGSTVFTQTKTVAKGSQQFGFEITNLPAGMYFLQVATGREVISTKVVKE